MRHGYVGLGFGVPRLDLGPSEMKLLQCAAQVLHLRYCTFDGASEKPDITLPPRERETLQWIARGKSNAVIATIPGRAPHTEETLVQRIYVKMGVNDRTTAVIRGLGAGLSQYHKS